MTELNQNTSHELPFTGQIRELRKEDLPSIKPILETWIRDMKTREIIASEVSETLKSMEESLAGNNQKTYFVAENKDRSLAGTMGMSVPDERLLGFCKTDKPIEVINAMVDNKFRRQGVGRALVTTIREEAKKRGYTELILVSGPRYMFTGWAAWNKLFGKHVAIAKDYFGEGASSPVWQQIL